MNITLIAAMSLQGVIGNANDIPWTCPEDLAHFKVTTRYRVVIMGRKTYESIGQKPLPDRLNIVLSRQWGDEEGDIADNGKTCLIKASDMTKALEYLEYFDKRYSEVFVIGGGEIYRQALPIATRLIISHMHIPVVGDVKFPEFDLDVFRPGRVEHRLDASVPFTIVHYHRTPT